MFHISARASPAKKEGRYAHSLMLKQASQEGIKAITHWVEMTDFMNLRFNPKVSDLTCHE